MRLLAENRRPVSAAVLTVALGCALAGCGNSAEAPTATRSPADLLLTKAELPAGFEQRPLTVADLVAQNKAGLQRAQTMPIAPDFCRPTADADLNARLRPDNAAVLAATRWSSTLIQVVTTERRDLAADLRATTSRCARTEATIIGGNVAGTKVVTVYTQLPPPQDDGGLGADDRVLLLRSEVTVTLPDGGVRKEIDLAGYAVVSGGRAGPVSIGLTVNGGATRAANPPVPARAPMPDDQFGKLFADALAKATE